MFVQFKVFSFSCFSCGGGESCEKSCDGSNWTRNGGGTSWGRKLLKDIPPFFRGRQRHFDFHRRVFFSVSGVLGLCCALTAAVVTGLPLWIRGTALCRTGAELVNATGPELDKFLGELSYGLFTGQRLKQCGLGGRASRFYFFPDLQSVIPTALHVTIIFFCGVVILFSSVATGFFFVNAFGRPYEMLQGPMGLYLWTFICCVSSCLVMILFASEVKLYHLSDRIANFNEVNFVFQTYSESYDRCFWLFFLVFLLHGINFLLIRLAGIQFPFRETKESDGSGGADLMY